MGLLRSDELWDDDRTPTGHGMSSQDTRRLSEPQFGQGSGGQSQLAGPLQSLEPNWSTAELFSATLQVVEVDTAEILLDSLADVDG